MEDSKIIKRPYREELVANTEMEDEEAVVRSSYEDRRYDEWKDSQFESVMTSILNGKSLTEALNEKQSWEETSEEQYSSSEIAQHEYETDYKIMVKNVSDRLEKFMSGLKDLRLALNICYEYDIPYYDVEGCPFKNLASFEKDSEKWILNIMDTIKRGK